MKKFAGFKSHDEIQHQCENPPQQGMLPEPPVPFNDHLYRERGYDTVVVGDINDRRYGHVIYNTFNGRFFGTTPMLEGAWPPGVDFNSNSAKFDSQPWFAALLEFFYK